MTCLCRSRTWFVDITDEAEEAAETIKSVVEQHRKDIDAYTNETQEGRHGFLWKTEVDWFAKSFLVTASQAMAQIWTEEYWYDLYPRVELRINPLSIEQCHQWVRARMELEIDDAVTTVMRFTTFERMMPMGARNIVMRLSGSQASDPKTVCFKMLSTNIAENISEMFEEETAVRLIGYDTTHPLYDCLFMALVDIEMSGGGSGIKFRQQQVISANELSARAGSELRKTTGKGLEPRRPVIVQVKDEWMVHHDNRWWIDESNKDTFMGAFLIYLHLMHTEFNDRLESHDNLEHWMKPGSHLGPYHRVAIAHFQ